MRVGPSWGSARSATIADALMETLGAHGVGVVCEAFHLCMMMLALETPPDST
jgi:GTP cyclohydrolase I